MREYQSSAKCSTCRALRGGGQYLGQTFLQAGSASEASVRGRASSSFLTSLDHFFVLRYRDLACDLKRRTAQEKVQSRVFTRQRANQCKTTGECVPSQRAFAQRAPSFHIHPLYRREHNHPVSLHSSVNSTMLHRNRL